MALGDIGSQLDSVTLGTTGTPDNEPGIHLFKVSSGIYILFYHVSGALRAATFAIDTSTGVITSTVIEDVEIIAAQDTDRVDTVAQIIGTCYVTSNSAGGSNLGYATANCDGDGTNLGLTATKTVAHGGITSNGLFQQLDANNVVLVTPGSSPDIETRTISDAGAIGATAIQSQEFITSPVALAWISSSDTLITIDPSGTARTYELNGDGTFDNTVVDSISFHTGSSDPVSIVVVDDANGICAVAVQNSQGGNDETAVYRITVASDRTMTSSEYFSQTATDTNRYRPTVFAISDPDAKAFLWLEEGTRSVTSVGSDFVTIEIASNIVDAATKGPYFALVSNLIGVIAHNNTVGGTGVDITTFGLLTGGASAVLTGTIFGAREEDIVNGGETLIITLTGITWDADIGSNNSQTTALINGLDSAQSEGTGWDAVVKAGLAFGDVTRNSDTVVTILFPAFSTYFISAPEVITVTIESTSAS